MSIELILSTFQEESDPTRKLPRIARIISRRMQTSGQPATNVESTPETLLVHLPGGTAEIRADDAQFPIQTLDPLTLNILFDVAIAGDMIIITEGGDSDAIVVSPQQRQRLPEEWQPDSASPICFSPEELGFLLRPWFREHSEYRNHLPHDDEIPPQRQLTPADLGLAPRRELYDTTLHRFDPTGNDIPRDPNVLQDLLELCQIQIQKEAQHPCRIVLDDYPPVSLRVHEVYSVDIWPNRAKPSYYEMTPALSQLLFDIARRAEMTFVLGPRIIVVAPDQIPRLPQSWRQLVSVIPCNSPEELRSFFLQTSDSPGAPLFQFPFNHQGFPAPGTWPGRRTKCLYLEAKPKESANRQFNKVIKFHHKNDAGIRQPQSGMMGSEFWQLETPEQKRFFAYDFGGDTAGWQTYFQGLAAAEDRLLGSIINFETFTQSNTHSFPLTHCTLTKVDSNTK